MRRLEAGDSGLQLRLEEDEAMAGVANAASYNQGGSLASQYSPSSVSDANIYSGGPPKWAEVALHHTRPASTNTQLSSAAC